MSLNKVMLIGNVGKDPEVRYIDQGIASAVINLATNTPSYTLPNGTLVPERTEWHRVILWRKLAETAEKYVHKGDKLYIEGELRTRSYTDKQGRSHSITEVWGSSMEILTPKANHQQTPTSEEKASAPTKEPNEQLPF